MSSGSAVLKYFISFAAQMSIINAAKHSQVLLLLRFIWIFYLVLFYFLTFSFFGCVPDINLISFFLFPEASVLSGLGKFFFWFAVNRFLFQEASCPVKGQERIFIYRDIGAV